MRRGSQSSPRPLTMALGHTCSDMTFSSASALGSSYSRQGISLSHPSVGLGELLLQGEKVIKGGHALARTDSGNGQ